MQGNLVKKDETPKAKPTSGQEAEQKARNLHHKKPGPT
jgi:hypothetical protein